MTTTANPPQNVVNRGMTITADPQSQFGMGATYPIGHQQVHQAMPYPDSQQTTQAMPQQTNQVMQAYPPLWNMFSMPPPPLPPTHQVTANQANDGTYVQKQGMSSRGDERKGKDWHHQTRRRDEDHEDDTYDDYDQYEDEYNDDRHGRRRSWRRRNDSFDQPRRRRNQSQRGWDAEDQSFNKLIPRPKRYDGTTNFGSYEVQFKIYAERASWTSEAQLNMFAILVDGKALDYFVTNKPKDGNYSNIEEVFKKFRARFGRTELPQSLRNEFQQLRQKSDESIDDWADRVQAMGADAFVGMAETFINEETVRRFCQGLHDKEAATLVGSRLPRTLSDAIQAVKEYACNQKAVYGATKKVRTVSFENSEPVIRKVEREEVQEMVKKEIADFKKIFTDFAKQFSSTSTSSNRNTFRSPPRPSTPDRRQNSPQRVPSSPKVVCFTCRKEGHFSKDCKLSPRRPLICYKCQKEGHVIRDCPDKKQSPTSTSSSLNSPRSK